MSTYFIKCDVCNKDIITEAARKLGYAVIKEEDLEIREKESRELAYIKLKRTKNI